MALFLIFWGLFWIISLEIGGNIVGRIIGDYRGKYKIQWPSRSFGSLFTGVISPSQGLYRVDFLVFLGPISAIE